MILQVKISPHAAKSSIEGWQGECLRIRIAAVPDKGKANEALLEFLADELDLPKSGLRLLSGHASRLKRIEIPSIPNREALLAKLKKDY